MRKAGDAACSLRAGFEIVDCPPVTSQGKTSTDIHMVLDIIDLLQHETRCDEFIVTTRLFNQILFLCEREQKVLDQSELAHIRTWIGSPATAYDLAPHLMT